MTEAADPAAQPPVAAARWPVVILAVLAVIWALDWAQAVLIPILLGVLVSYALRPVVERLHHWRIPRPAGAALVLLGILGGVGALAVSLGDEAKAWIDNLPEAAENFRSTLGKAGAFSSGALDQVQEAAEQLERAAKETAGPASVAPRGVTRVQIEKPRLNVQEFLWTGTVGALAMVGQCVVVLFLVFFLLAAGDTFRRKLVRITGPVLSRQKVTLQVLDEITSLIQRYLLMQIATSVVVGVATWLAFVWIGLENAAIWGIAAAVLNNVPYLGPVVVSGGTALLGLLQFGTIEMALLVGGVSLLITTLEGYLLTPWLAGKAGRINPVAIFLGILLWGWLWGVWGLLLGMPITMVIKAVCDRVEGLQQVGELLGA